LVFNGTNNYSYRVNSNSNPSEFSIAVWFRTTSTAGNKIIGFETNQTHDLSIARHTLGTLVETYNFISDPSLVNIHHF
jgi:hypothetical protein